MTLLKYDFTFYNDRFIINNINIKELASEIKCEKFI